MSVGRAIGLLVGAAAWVFVCTSQVFAAGGELPPLVRDIGVAFLLSGLLSIFFVRIRVPAIAGYILGGILAGPLVLGLVTDPVNIETIAELGFVLLLFVLGLEINVTKIIGSGRTIILTGLLSVPLIALLGYAAAGLLALAGFGGIIGGNLGLLYVGLAISVSSTLLVIKLFQETFELDTVPGRLALGILVVEDLWAIVIILLQPSLLDPHPIAILASFVGIGLLAGIALLISRTLIPIAFRWIAKVPEVVLVGAVAWCFAVVFIGSSFDWVTESVLGINFHLNVGSGMGALIAGVTIASLPYSNEIITKVNVVKDFFVTLFFVSLGMSIPLPSGPGVLLLTLAIAGIAIAARQLILFPLLYWNGADQRNAQVAAIRMAQISEFSLVVTFLGVTLGHLSPDLATAIILAFVLTALTTTPLFKSAYRIHQWISPILQRVGFKEPPGAESHELDEWKLAILGFHRIASSLLYDIVRDEPELAKQTLVIDFAVTLHEKIRQTGAHVGYGDLSNPDTLHHAGLDRARVILSTVPDDLLRGVTNAQLVANVRKINPSAVIIASALTLADVKPIYAAGADYVFLPRIDSAEALTDAITNALNGSIAEYRTTRELAHGGFVGRSEVLP